MYCGYTEGVGRSSRYVLLVSEIDKRLNILFRLLQEFCSLFRLLYEVNLTICLNESNLPSKQALPTSNSFPTGLLFCMLINANEIRYVKTIEQYFEWIYCDNSMSLTFVEERRKYMFALV